MSLIFYSVKNKIQGYRGVIDETEPQTGKQGMCHFR
jgi:hypothetical protein